jgi:hypothetical protein
MTPLAIYNEIKICTSIVDTAKQVLRGFRCNKSTRHIFAEKIEYFSSIVKINTSRINVLQADLEHIALTWNCKQIG